MIKIMWCEHDRIIERNKNNHMIRIKKFYYLEEIWNIT